MLILQLVGISCCHVLWSPNTDLLNLSRIWNNCLQKENKKKSHTKCTGQCLHRRNAYRSYGHFHRGAAKPKIYYWEQPRIVVVIIAIWEIAYLGLSKALPGFVTQRRIAGSRRGPCHGCGFRPRKKRKRKETRGRRGRRHTSERDSTTGRLWSLLVRACLVKFQHTFSTPHERCQRSFAKWHVRYLRHW